MVYIIHINQKDVIKINICRLIFKEITNNCYFCCFPLSGGKNLLFRYFDSSVGSNTTYWRALYICYKMKTINIDLILIFGVSAIFQLYHGKQFY